MDFLPDLSAVNPVSFSYTLSIMSETTVFSIVSADENRIDRNIYVLPDLEQALMDFLPDLKREPQGRFDTESLENNLLSKSSWSSGCPAKSSTLSAVNPVSFSYTLSIMSETTEIIKNVSSYLKHNKVNTDNSGSDSDYDEDEPDALCIPRAVRFSVLCSVSGLSVSSSGIFP